MRRREFMTLLGGAAAWPLAARAQQATIPVIGFLSSGSLNAYAQYAIGFRQGLKESGYVEGQNVAIEYRWGNGQYDLLPALAADLVRREVAVIVASGGPPPALAARAATFTIPIIFSSIDEPIKLGLIASLNRPGGNATGMSLFRKELVSKQLELLHDLVPKAEVVAVLVNPANRQSDGYVLDIREAILVLQRQLRMLSASTEAEIDASFRASSNRVLVRSLSRQIRCSTTNEINLRHWPHATCCLPCPSFANSLRQVA